MFDNPKLYKLSNGIRVLLDPIPSIESTAMYVMVGTGSRNELPAAPGRKSELGISHVLEHMAFKGTSRRDSHQISREIADNGGLINAYTSYDVTAYHIVLLQDRLDFAMDILSDIVLNSTFPEDELKKEKSVILQEILMYMDIPDAETEKLLSEVVFPGGGLGHDVAGTMESVFGIERDDILAYQKATYSAENTIISLSGAGLGNPEEILAKLEKLFGGMQKSAPRDYIRSSYHQGVACKLKPELEHTYLKVAWESFPCSERDKTLNAKLASAILGFGMHSRLFEEVREKQNLVYSVAMGNTAFEDVGMVQINAQTTPDNVEKTFAACAKIITELKTNPLTDEELSRTKAVYRASKTIGMENPEARADYFAHQMLMFGGMEDLRTQLENIDRAQLGDVMSVVSEIVSKTPTIIAYGAENSCVPDSSANLFVK
ncbi:MAG: insulinase family protein [Rickettsiales bacterium]|jgi:predicted Zn-dependent peptidase|nr:insulinase family protein [Rickettsiales bacterium]